MGSFSVVDLDYNMAPLSVKCITYTHWRTHIRISAVHNCTSNALDNKDLHSFPALHNFYLSTILYT